MNRPVSLLWFEGMDPQCLALLPALKRFLSHGCDVQLEPVPLIEHEQCIYQVLTGMGPGRFGRFDDVRVDAYQVLSNTGLPSGAIEHLLPEVIQRQGAQVLTVELRTRDELAALSLYTADFSLLRFRDANERSLEELNALVQLWLERLPATAQCLVLTDVFSPPARALVNVNNFLASVGLLKRNSDLSISWPETLAYGVGSGQVWLNARGREPQGVVRAGRDFYKVAALVAHELSTRWLDPRTGELIVERVLTKEEAYAGEYLFKAPDLTLLYRPGYAPSPNARALRLDGESVQQECEGGTLSPQLMQKPYARLLASGSEFRQGYTGRTSLLNLFPSILHLLGLSLPALLDGQVIDALFSQASLAHAPVKYRALEEEPLSREDESLILARLRELGYLG